MLTKIKLRGATGAAPEAARVRSKSGRIDDQKLMRVIVPMFSNREDNPTDDRLKTSTQTLRRRRRTRRHRKFGSARLSAAVFRRRHIIPRIVVRASAADHGLRHGTRLHPQ